MKEKVKAVFIAILESIFDPEIIQSQLFQIYKRVDKKLWIISTTECPGKQ